MFKKTTLTYLVLLLVLALYIPAQEKPGPEASELLQKVFNLDQKGKKEEAIRLLNEGLVKFSQPNYDRYFILNYKFNLFLKQNRYDEAINIAIEKANIIKSPKQALNVAEAYLIIKDNEQALSWINKSIERGLQSYTVLEKDIYDPIRKDKKFSEQIDIVKKRNGIGLPAKPFIRKSINGNELTLSNYKGKVVLIDFWATWCKPCLVEMPKLKKYYGQFKEKGFEIIGFSEDNNLDRLQKYLKENDINWENVFCPLNAKDETVKLYKVVNIPASFLIDKNGIVREVNLTGNDLENAIVKLINE